MDYKSKVDLVSKEQIIFAVHTNCIMNGIPEKTFFEIKKAIESVQTVDLNKAVELYFLTTE